MPSHAPRTLAFLSSLLLFAHTGCGDSSESGSTDLRNMDDDALPGTGDDSDDDTGDDDAPADDDSSPSSRNDGSVRPRPVVDAGFGQGTSKDGSTPAPLIDAATGTNDASAPAKDWQPVVLGECGDGPLSFEGLPAQPSPPDWKEGAKVPITGWANRYGLSGQALVDTVRKGREHTVYYPVEVTGSWMPMRLIEGAMKIALPVDINPLAEYKDLTAFEDWLHLHPYPDCDGKGARSIPYPGGKRPNEMMGSTRKKTADGDVLTYSCAGCHASSMFGRSILGLQNRFSRANLGVDKAAKAIGNESVFGELAIRVALGATDGEMRILKKLQASLRQVGTSPPLVRGLDTSLAQVALSLNKRKKDPYASSDANLVTTPRPDWLDKNHADSKPGNWWVLKYKNRWLLDGSVVSGNPVYTNLLWNEIGRGTDLKALDAWIDQNLDVVDQITAAVFATEPVPFTDFFTPESVDLEAAKRGKVLFDGTCARCHGTYEKGWEQSNAASLALKDRLATVEVRYHEDTPVVDVGTDGNRNKGMESLLQLNDLQISKKSGTVIKVQKGYVPPPLVGIWARYPYFHNNAAPSLCAVLTRAEDRPATYYAGEANDPKLDFDRECNGYPSGDAVPAAWLKDPEALYDSKIPGLGKQGHDEGVFLKDGVELFTPDQKRDIIRFLQTL
jgi:mono/diheme cytochrome c family protein